MAGLDHSVRAYTDKAADLVEEFGGKMGGLEFMRRNDSLLAKHILPSINIRPGDPIPDNEKFRAIANDGYVIDRGSHWTDMQGMVDVFKTNVSAVDLPNQVAIGVESIRAAALSPEVMNYGKYENAAYDGRVVVGIQPYMRGPRGSIVDHPNRDGYVISGVRDDECTTALYDEEGRLFHNFNSLGDRPIVDSRLLVDIHKRVRKLGLFRDDVSFQLEFGMPDETYIFQARAFLPRIRADFRLPDDPFYDPRLCFGVTPEEGIVLPVVHVRDGVEWKKEFDLDGGFAAVGTYHGLMDGGGRNPSLNLRPKNLQAYLSAHSYHDRGGTGVPGLEHNEFTLIQKSDVSVMENVMEGSFDRFLLNAYLPEYVTGSNVRVVCDGIRSSVEAITR